MAPLGGQKKNIDVSSNLRLTLFRVPICASAAAFGFLLVFFALSSKFVRIDNNDVNLVDASLSDQAFTQFSELYEKSSNRPLSIEILTIYYHLIGPSRILDVLETDPFCHDKGHNLGRVVFNTCGNLAESIQICENRCTGACYHGALMQYFQDIKSSSSKRDNFTDIDIRPYFSSLCSLRKNEDSLMNYFTISYWWNERTPDSAEVIEEMYGKAGNITIDDQSSPYKFFCYL